MAQAQAAASSGGVAALLCRDERINAQCTEVLQQNGIGCVALNPLPDLSNLNELLHRAETQDRLIVCVADFESIEHWWWQAICKVLLRFSKNCKPVCIIDCAGGDGVKTLKKKYAELVKADIDEYVNVISEDELNNWLQYGRIFLLTVGENECQPTSGASNRIVNEIRCIGYRVERMGLNELEWDAISRGIEDSDRIVVVYFKPQGQVRSHSRCHLYHLAINRCIEQGRELMCIMKRYSGEDKMLDNHRVKSCTTMIDLQDLNVGIDEMKKWLKKDVPGFAVATVKFGSLGASFAWQYAAGFLCFILPNLQKKIKDDLLDGNGIIRQDVLDKLNLRTQRESVCVLEKFIILLKESDVDAEDPVHVYPDPLFKECSKVADLNLRFESESYPKTVCLYCIELNEPIDRYSHVLLPGCYAAPTSAIHDFNELQQEAKHKEFQSFREELQHILNHPKVNELLHKFSCSDEEGVDAEKNACVIDVENSDNWDELLLSRIREEVHNQIQLDGLTEMERDEPKAKSLVIKFTKRFEDSDVAASIMSKLADNDFTIHNFEMMSETFAHVLMKCQRVMMIVDLQDLIDFTESYNDGNYQDAEHNNLLRDITSSVTYMHIRSRYNIVILVVTNGHQQEDIFSLLPPSLRVLPEQNVVTISTLTADQSHNFRCSFTEDSNRTCTMDELIRKLRLNEECPNAVDNVPNMSMAYAMAVNLYFGMLNKLLTYAEVPNNELLFRLPYVYLLPTSGRFPNRETLINSLRQINVTREQQRFVANNGRTYTIDYYTQGTLSIPGEMPPAVFSLRKQASSGIGGVRLKDVPNTIRECGEALNEICRSERMSEQVKVVIWDDVNELGINAWRDPDLTYAKAFFKQLKQAYSPSSAKSSSD